PMLLTTPSGCLRHLLRSHQFYSDLHTEAIATDRLLFGYLAIAYPLRGSRDLKVTTPDLHRDIHGYGLTLFLRHPKHPYSSIHNRFVPVTALSAVLYDLFSLQANVHGY